MIVINTVLSIVIFMFIVRDYLIDKKVDEIIQGMRAEAEYAGTLDMINLKEPTGWAERAAYIKMMSSTIHPASDKHWTGSLRG